MEGQIKAQTRRNIKKTIINISVMGVGGAGNNTLENIPKEKFPGIKFIYANTDKQVLEKYNPQHVLNLNVGDINDGLGAGADPKMGKFAAQNSLEAIKYALSETRLLILTAGLGGGTGTGATPVIAKVAKEMGILTVAIVTTPFSLEGPKRKANALSGLEELKTNVDAYVVVSNDKLLNHYPDVAMVDAFQLANNVLKNCIKAFTDLMVKTALINLDFADLTTTIKDKGEAYIGFGMGIGKNKDTKAIDAVLNSKIIETSIKGANNIIINIVADASVSILQATQIVEIFKQRINQEADIIFGFDVDMNLRNEIQIAVIATTNKNLVADFVAQEPTPGLTDDAKTQETLIKIGNTLELEFSGSQPVINDEASEPTEPLHLINAEEDEENIFIEVDESDDDIPFFLK